MSTATAFQPVPAVTSSTSRPGARERALAVLLEAVERWRDMSGCDVKEIALTLGVDESTLHRWRARQSCPSHAGESRLWLLKELVGEFDEMFVAAPEDGYAWLRTRVPALGRKCPLDVLRAGGIERVLALLGRANRGEPE